MMRRITAGLLALMMIVSMFPAVVHAEESGAYGIGQVLWVQGKKVSGEYVAVAPTAATVENGEWAADVIDGVQMVRDGCKYSAYMGDEDLVFRHEHSAGCRSSDSPDIICGQPVHTNAMHAQQCYLKADEFRWYVKDTQAPDSGDGEDGEGVNQYPSGKDDAEGEINLVVSNIDTYGDAVNGAIFILAEYAQTEVTDANGNTTTRRELRFVGNPAIVDDFQAQAAQASQEKLDKIDELNAIGDPNGEVAALIAELNEDSRNTASQLQTLQWQMTPRQTDSEGKVYFRSLEKYLDENNAETDGSGNKVWTWYLSQDGNSFASGMPLNKTHQPNNQIWTVKITRYASGGYNLDVQPDKSAFEGENGYSGPAKNGAMTFVNKSLKCKLVVGFECLDAATGEALMGQYVKNENGYLVLANDDPQKILDVLAVVHVDGPNDYSEDLIFSENSGSWQKELTNLDPGTYTMTLRDKSMGANGYTWSGSIAQTLEAGGKTNTGSDVTSVELGQNCTLATYTYTAEFEQDAPEISGNCQLIVEFRSMDQATNQPLMGQNLKDDDGKEILDDKGNPQKILTGYAYVNIDGPDGYHKELWFTEETGWQIPVTGLAPGEYTVSLQNKSMSATGYTWAGEVVQTMEVGGETSDTDTAALSETTNTATCIFTAQFKPTGYQQPVGTGTGKLNIRFDCIDQTNNTSLIGKTKQDANGTAKKILADATARILVTDNKNYSRIIDFSEKTGKWEEQLTNLPSGTYQIILLNDSNLKATGYTWTGVNHQLKAGGQTQTGSGATTVTLSEEITEATYTCTAVFKPGESGSSTVTPSNGKVTLVVSFECVENVANTETGMTTKNLLMGRYQQGSDGTPVLDENGNYKKLLNGQAVVTVTGPDGYQKELTFSEQESKWTKTLNGLQPGEYSLSLSNTSRMQAEGYNWVGTTCTLVTGKETITGNHVSSVVLGDDSPTATFTYTAEFQKGSKLQNLFNNNKNANNDDAAEEEEPALLGEIVIKAVDDRGLKLTGAKFELHGKRDEPVPLEVDSRGIIQEDWGAYAEEGKQLSWVIKQSNEIEGHEMTTDEFSVQITKFNGQPKIEIVCIQEGNLFERLLKSDKIKEGSDGETILYFKNPRKTAQVNVSYDLKVDVESTCRDAAETKKAFQKMKHQFILSWKDDNGKPKEELLELEAGKTGESEVKLPFGKEYTLTVANAEEFNCKINGETASVLREKIGLEQTKTGNINVKVNIEYDINRGPDQDLYMTKVSKLARKPLKGAKFVLKNAYGKEIQEYVTKEDGALDIEGLLTEVGTYQLKETKAPLGCLRLRKPIELKVVVGYTPQEINDHVILQQGLQVQIENSAVELQEDGTYEILNTKLGENPRTGDSSYIFLWAGVLVVSAGGLAFLLIRRTRNKRKGRKTETTTE